MVFTRKLYLKFSDYLSSRLRQIQKNEESIGSQRVEVPDSNSVGGEKVKTDKKEEEPLVYYVTFSSEKTEEDERVDVENVVVHPSYEKKDRSPNENDHFHRWTHDVALLKLKKRATEATMTPSEEIEVTEDEVLDAFYGEEGYWMYDSVENDVFENPEREVACVRNSYQKFEENSDLFFFGESDGSNCVVVGHQQM